MSEDVSAYMRLSITVWMTAAFLAVVCNVLVMGMSILNNYSDKYTYNLAQGYLQNLISLQNEKYVAAPICHTAIDQAADQVVLVYYKCNYDNSVDITTGMPTYGGTTTINGEIEPEVQVLYSYNGLSDPMEYSYCKEESKYKLRGNRLNNKHDDTLTFLMTKYKLENVRVIITPHDKLSGMYIVELEVVN